MSTCLLLFFYVYIYIRILICKYMYIYIYLIYICISVLFLCLHIYRYDCCHDDIICRYSYSFNPRHSMWHHHQLPRSRRPLSQWQSFHQHRRFQLWLIGINIQQFFSVCFMCIYILKFVCIYIYIIGKMLVPLRWYPSCLTPKEPFKRGYTQ